MKKILILTLTLILLINIISTNTDAYTRYTRITGDDPFYIITGESTNNSNTHYNYYRIELDPDTYELINKTKILGTDNLYSDGGYPTQPYYYNNKIYFGSGIYDINTLLETPESIASWVQTRDYNYLGGFYLPDLKYPLYYDPINKISYTTNSRTTGANIAVYADYYDYHLNEVYSVSGSASTLAVAIHPYSNGGLIRRTTTSAGQLISPAGTIISSAPVLPGVQKSYSMERLPSSSYDPSYFYTHTAGGSPYNVLVQYIMNNQSTSVRTITSSLSSIYSHTPVSSRSNYLYIVGYYTITGTPNVNVASIEVRDRTGNLITGQNSVIGNSTYTFITELETGDIALIRQNTDTGEYDIEIRNPLTLNLIKNIDYNTTRIYSISSRLTNRKGIDPYQFNLLNSGVYSRETGGFDAVPKTAYLYSYNSTLPSGVTINDIDYTNRIFEFTLELDEDINYYNLDFLVDDDDFTTNTNEKYGYIILDDMQLLESINTGTITGSDTFNLSNYLGSNRFYILDTNITILNTTSTDYSVAVWTLNEHPFFGLVNRFTTPGSSILDEYIGLFDVYGTSPFFTENSFDTPHLLSYPEIAGASHDYTNLKILVDKYNNRYSIKKITYYNDGSSFDSGFITWASLPSGSDSIEDISISIGDNTSISMDMDVYRTTLLPTLAEMPLDATFSDSKVLSIPILKSGVNKVLVAYNDYSITQHANFEEWTITINTLGGDILGISPTPGTTPDDEVYEGIEDGTPLFGGLLPDFMNNTQNSAMLYAFGIIILVMIIMFLLGHSAGYPIIGFIGSLAFMFMLIIYFSIIGWLPTWIPIVGFVFAGLIGAGMIRSMFVGGNA